MCLPSCTEKAQFMCIIKMDKITVYANTQAYNVLGGLQIFSTFFLLFNV